MGNIITNTSSLTTALDLADGNAKIKKDLAVVGKSTFTGDSTFNGNLSVTNGKVNDVNIPTLGTDVSTLKTDVKELKTTVTNVSAGSFTGKAISGATDVTATGTGTFNSVKTNAIDINGDITSTTGGKYILGNGTTGLFLTNGQPTTKAEVLLNKDGSVEIKPSSGKIVKVNDIEFSKVQIPGTTNFLNTMTANGLISVGGISNTGAMTATGRITANGGVTTNGLTVSSGSILQANGGINASSISVSGTTTSTGALTANGGITASTLSVTGASTLTGATTATGALTANGGLTASTLSVSGASTLTGATTATGAITANGGLTASTLTVSGDSTHTGATTATGLITANGGVKSTTITTTGDINAKNIIIGTNKFLIEEVVDTAKGTRLCFGKTDGTAKTFFTCMRADNGNLELF